MPRSGAAICSVQWLCLAECSQDPVADVVECFCHVLLSHELGSPHSLLASFLLYQKTTFGHFHAAIVSATL